MEQELSGKQQKGHCSNRPPLLNVLTILTMIGCMLWFASGIWSYFFAQKSYQALFQTMQSPVYRSMMTGTDKALGNEVIETARITANNRISISLSYFIGSILCFWGARLMRRLRKDGFFYWLFGEIIPISVLFYAHGFRMFRGWNIAMYLLMGVFFILYLTQLKYLRTEPFVKQLAPPKAYKKPGRAIKNKD